MRESIRSCFPRFSSTHLQLQDGELKVGSLAEKFSWQVPIEGMFSTELSNPVGERGWWWKWWWGRTELAHKPLRHLPLPVISEFSGFSFINPPPVIHRGFKRPSECWRTSRRGRHGEREDGPPVNHTRVRNSATMATATKIPKVSLMILVTLFFLRMKWYIFKYYIDGRYLAWRKR